MNTLELYCIISYIFMLGLLIGQESKFSENWFWYLLSPLIVPLIVGFVIGQQDKK